MKKTLITAVLALFSLAASASTLTTYTTTNNDKTSAETDVAYTQRLWSNGFGVTLSSSGYSRLETTISSGTTEFSSSSLTQLTLNSVSVSVRDVKANPEATTAGGTAVDVYLALTDADHKVIALSTNSTITAGQFFSWTFTDTTVGKTDTLYFQFVDGTRLATSSEADGIKVGSTLTAADLVIAGLDGSNSVANYGTNNVDGLDTLFLIGGNNRNMTQTSSQYAPAITISTTEVVSVPEPATATLSLLALAGLAARRRRK